MRKRKAQAPDLEKYLDGKGRRFVNYAQGAELYDVSYWSFVRAAKEAQSNYPIRKPAIVDLNILEKFLEENPQVVARLEESSRKRHEK